MVANTTIFARGDGPYQFLVYRMAYAAEADVAMVLPLPVPPNPPDDAVRFIDLSGYHHFFDDMSRGFPPVAFLSRSRPTKGMTRSMPPLVVHAVGDFEASFVPRVADFDRLDPRFRLPEGVWDQLPAYRDYGFAVFKLKGTRPPSLMGRLLRPIKARSAGSLFVHPMAFRFPRRDQAMFFPTVHVHDGAVHANADFDHILYAQGETPDAGWANWQKSNRVAGNYVNVGRTEGIVDGDSACWRRVMKGNLANRDVVLASAG